MPCSVYNPRVGCWWRDCDVTRGNTNIMICLGDGEAKLSRPCMEGNKVAHWYHPTFFEKNKISQLRDLVVDYLMNPLMSTCK